jgi:DNA polymerase III subunit epsilon
MIREIVLDTETTGLKPEDGHRIVEIGCIELVNHLPTGAAFHRYLDPGRPMDPDASRVSGITDEMLEGKPDFSEIVEDLLAFLGDAPLVIHNAAFDMGFLNAEFARIGFGPMTMDRAIDTVLMARRKFPGSPASLDALCKRFDIDLSGRAKHGALIDAELLAKVYLELIGGRQPGLLAAGPVAAAKETGGPAKRASARPVALPSRLTAEDAARHEAFIATLKGGALWTKAPG